MLFGTLTLALLQGKLAGAQWKTISDDEKAKYQAMADKDKERYNEEMKNYTPPAGTTSAGASKTPKKGKAKKDPNAPKKPMTAYFHFNSEMRPKVKKEDPDLSFGDVGKKIGAMFRELSEEDKEKYEKLAEKDKKRYKKEMEAYEARKKSEAAAAADNGDDDDDSDPDGLNDAHDDDDDSDDDSD